MANLLPLDSWRRIIGYNPFHFWGLANELVPVTSACNDVVYQYAWQAQDAAGRSDILEAIERAEGLLAEQLGFWPAPAYLVDTLPFPQHVDRSAWRMSHAGADDHWLDVRTSKGQVQEIGVMVREFIDTEGLALSDDDADGLDDTFIITVATTVTDPAQIAIYVPAAQRLHGDAVSEKYRILPVTVTIAAGTATIKGRAWTIVKPYVYEGVGKSEIDPSDSKMFLEDVEVYRIYTDPDGNTYSTSQATLIWETEPYPAWAVCCGCGSSSPTDNSTDPAAEAYGIARAGIRNARAGLVNVGRAVYNATTGVWSSTNWGLCRPPARVTVRYLAGQPLVNNEMDPRFQRAVARLAAAELSQEICACDRANRELSRWQFDLARSAGANDEQYTVSQADLNNPFGTRRGHVDAWRFVKSFRNLEGISI